MAATDKRAEPMTAPDDGLRAALPRTKAGKALWTGLRWLRGIDRDVLLSDILATEAEAALAATNRGAEPLTDACGHQITPTFRCNRPDRHTGNHKAIPPHYPTVVNDAAAPSESEPPALDVEAIDAALEFVIDHLDGFHTGECRCRQRIEAIRARLASVSASEEEPE